MIERKTPLKAMGRYILCGSTKTTLHSDATTAHVRIQSTSSIIHCATLTM